MIVNAKQGFGHGEPWLEHLRACCPELFFPCLDDSVKCSGRSSSMRWLLRWVGAFSHSLTWSGSWQALVWPLPGTCGMPARMLQVWDN